MLPWTDRTGRFAWLKCLTFAAVFVPACWIGIEAWSGWLGSRPVMEAIHQSGLWAVRLLALTMAVTPLRAASRWSKLVSIRRILGVSAMAYAMLHLCLYVLSQNFDLAHVASEIVLRIYLTIGFVAFCGLCVLGATSTDGMIARLGAPRWSRLQQLVYPIVVLAVLHFFMQSKLDVTQPILMAGLFALLFADRIARRRLGDPAAWQIAGLAVAMALATGLGEALWYAVSIGAPLPLVLGANLDFTYAVRPSWFMLGAGAILLGARLLRPLLAGAASPRRPHRPTIPVGTTAPGG